MQSSGIGAIARDVSAWAPNHTAGHQAMCAINKDTAALLVQGADLESAKDTVSIVAKQTTSVTIDAVDSGGASVEIVPANAARIGLHIVNTDTADLFIRYGGTATATSYTVKIAAGADWTMPPTYTYTGSIVGIWGGTPGSGQAVYTEIEA